MEEQENVGKLDQLKKRHSEIRIENSMLSEHLTRMVARKGSLQLHLENMEDEEAEKDDHVPPTAVESAVSAVSAMSRRRSSRKSFRVFHDGPPVPRSTVRFYSPPQRPTSPVPMSLEEKVEIVEEECESLRDSIEKIKAENERVLDDLRAVVKQALHSMLQTRTEKTTFYRELMVVSTLDPSKKLHAEDVRGYIEDKLRRKRNIRDKLQEKIDLLHMGIMEAEHQFSTKKDLKDILQRVDYDQLKIQNVQLHSRYDSRTQDIWNVKASTKRTLKILDVTRAKLNSAVKNGRHKKNCLRDRRPMVENLKVTVALEKKLHDKLNDAFLLALQEEDGPKRPRAMDYMRSKVQSENLFKELKAWSNKVEIAELTNLQLQKMVPRDVFEPVLVL